MRVITLRPFGRCCVVFSQDNEISLSEVLARVLPSAECRGILETISSRSGKREVDTGSICREERDPTGQVAIPGAAQSRSVMV